MAINTYFKTDYLRFIFGMGGVHPLPDGWRLIESPEDWLRAIDPDGQEYYLTQTHAYPRRVAKVAVGSLQPGHHYVDTQYGVVALPPGSDACGKD